MKAVQAFLEKPIAMVLIVVAIIAGIYFKGKADAKNKGLYQNPLPNNGTGIPATGTDSGGNPISWSPEQLATELYNALKGIWVLADTKETVFTKMSVLTNDQLTALYNRFNQLYYPEEKITMTKWIESEWNVAIVSVRDVLTNKLRALGLN